MFSLRVYVISLPEDRHRRDGMRERFGSAYESFEIIKGIRLSDVKSLTTEYGQVAYDSSLTMPELSCALTHRIALESFLRSGATHALILEDDAVGDAADIAAIEGMVRLLPCDTFLLCGGQEGLRGEPYNYGRSRDVSGVYQIPRFVRKFYTRACCYCVTAPSATRIVSMQTQYLQLSDDWDRYFRRWKHFFFTRRIAHPLDLSDSNIEHVRVASVPKNELSRIRRDGISKVLRRFFSKIVLRIFSGLLGLVRIR